MEAVQEDVLSVLSEVGLSEVEVSVYKAALALGSRPASVIAQKAGLKRGHTYNILESLMEKGIVQEFVKSSVRHFVCSSPHSLLSMLQKKEHELAEQKRKLERAIPHLEQIRNPVAAQPKVRFYKGLEAIKEIFEDMLAVPNSIIYGFIDLEQSWSSANEAGHYWTRNFIKRREQKNIAWHGIAVKSEYSDRAIQIRPSELRQMKMIEGITIPAEIHVYGSRVAITSTCEEMIGVIIESAPIAQTIRNIHQFLWGILPDYQSEMEEEVNEAAA